MATLIIEGSGTGWAEPRRRFSDDDKARIVSEAMLPGASVSDVARRHRVCSSLVYRWRRVLLRDGVAVEAPRLPAPAFVPVEIAGVVPSVSPEQLGPGVVEVICSGGQRGVSVSQAARDLDLYENVLRKWVREQAILNFFARPPPTRCLHGNKPFARPSTINLPK